MRRALGSFKVLGKEESWGWLTLYNRLVSVYRIHHFGQKDFLKAAVIEKILGS